MSTNIRNINEYCSKGEVEKLRALDNTELKNNLEKSTGLYGYTPLHSAATSNQKDVIKYLLDLNYKENYVNIRASSNYTPLHLAVSYVSIECVDCLIGYNADIDAKDAFGKTPIDIANDNKNTIIVTLLGKEKLKRTISHYLEVPCEDTETRNVVHAEIRRLLGTFKRNNKTDSEKTYKECIQELLNKFRKLSNPNIASAIDILGLITYVNNVPYPDQIMQCCENRKLHCLGWYQMLIRAITYDLKDIIKYLVFTIQIPAKCGNDMREYFEITSMGCVNSVIEHTKEERKKVKISLKFPIRLANQSNSQHLEQYLEWMLAQYSVSEELVNWHNLKIGKIPEKLFETEKIKKTRKLNVSLNLLRFIPRPILNLSYIESLNLSNNNFTNSIPCQILALVSLKCLDLSHNEIPGFTQNKNEGPLICQSLGKLFLNNNKIKHIKNDLFISRLMVIDLSNNQLNGVPTFLAKCTQQLTELDITGNSGLTKLPSFLGEFKCLDKIRLDLKQFPSLSVNNSHSSDEKAITKDIKKCLRGGRPIFATKIFCIGEGDEIRMRFLREFFDRSNLSCENKEDAFQLIDWENPRIAETHCSVKVWNVRNNNTEVMSKILKKLCQFRSLIFIIIDFKQGISKSIEKWIEEIVKMYPPNKNEDFDWINCVSIIAYNTIDCKSSEKIKICKQDFNQYTNSQIEHIRKSIFSGRFIKIRSYRYFYNYLHVEEDPISLEYTTIFKCFIGNKNKHNNGKEKIISIDTFIDFFKDTPALELIEGLKQTHRIDDFLDMFERLGLIEYIKELRDTPIVLDLCAFYNALVGIVLNEEQPYIKSGLLIFPYFITHIKEHPTPIKLKYNEDYMLLLRKFNLILMLSQSLYVLPSRLPKLKKKIDIEQLFSSSKQPEKINECGYIHRIFLIRQMSDNFCNKLIVDILYEMRLLRLITINNNPKLEEYFFKESDNITSPYSYIGEDITHAMSHQDMEFVSDDEIRSLSIWHDNLIFKDSGNELIILVRAYFVTEKEKGIEIAFTRDPNNIGESFLFRVKTILYNQQDYHRNIKDLIAVPHKAPKDETNTFIIDSFYKLLAIFEDVSNQKLNIKCEVRQGWMSDEVLAMFAPDIFLEKNYRGHNFTEMPYNTKNKLLGKGSCGAVYKGTFRSKQVAVKEFTCDNGDSKLRAYHEMLTEANILLEYRHSCLIDVIGVSSSSLKSCFMVLTYAPLGDLTSFLKNTLKPRILYLRIAQQIAAGVNFLHTHVKDVPLIHHDLKPENILVISNQIHAYINVKIADLNSSKNRAGKDGTQGYRAPEIISQNTMVSHDYKIDVFSYAFVLLYLITGRNPYREMGTADTLYTIKGMRPDLNWQQNFEKGIVSLLPIIQACWNQDPKKRPEMGSVLNALSLPSLQFLYSNRSLPLNSSYNPIKSCTVHSSEKLEILCYAFSTTFQGKDLYTRICYYDVIGNKMTDRNYEDFYKNKSLLQMCSHKNKVILTLKDVGTSDKCYLIRFTFSGNELTESKRRELDEEIFQVKTMCVDENNIYLTLDSNIYVFQLDSLEPGGIIEGVIDHPIQCIISLGNELWLSTEPSIRDKPSLSMRVLCKDTFNIHRIEQEKEKLLCIGQIVPTYQGPQETHKTKVQVWSLDLYQPHIYIFDAIEKEQIGELNLADFLPEKRKYSEDDKNKYNSKNTKMCASSNTMWVSTQFGCILVFSICPKKPELVTILDVFQGPIVFLSQLKLLSGSIVACCGQDFVHPFYHATEHQLYDILSVHLKEGNFTGREEVNELIEASNNTANDYDGMYYVKPKKHDIVLWEAYDAEVYQLVEKTKNSEFWGSKEAHTSPLSEEMLEIINQSDQEDYFMSDGYSSHENTTTL